MTAADPNVAALIREVLAEELAKIKPLPSASVTARAEPVSVRNDKELQALVHKVIQLCETPQGRRDLQEGHIRFTLAGTAGASASIQTGPRHAAATDITIEHGMVSERQIDRLAQGVTRLTLGKRVCLTPLARDRARKRGITIERMDT